MIWKILLVTVLITQPCWSQKRGRKPSGWNTPVHHIYSLPDIWRRFPASKNSGNIKLIKKAHAELIVACVQTKEKLERASKTFLDTCIGSIRGWKKKKTTRTIIQIAKDYDKTFKYLEDVIRFEDEQDAFFRKWKRNPLVNISILRTEMEVRKRSPLDDDQTLEPGYGKSPPRLPDIQLPSK